MLDAIKIYEMKEIQLPMMCYGCQLQVIVVCKNKKEASKILYVSLYYINTYAWCNNPKTEIAIKNPNQKFAYFDGGRLGEIAHELRGKVLPYKQLEELIKKDNKKRYG